MVDPEPAELETTTLTALVDYIKSGFDPKYEEKLLIHVISPSEVALYSELRADKIRENYMICKAMLPSIAYGRFLDPEEFVIMLQTRFDQNDDCRLLLKVVGNVKDEAVKTVGDNGISQAVTIKTGIAQIDNVLVPNPVNLAPFRTFPEIEQPISKFIFRMRKGPEAAIFEADGGAWRNEAMYKIYGYLGEQLAGIQNVSIIS